MDAPFSPPSASGTFHPAPSHQHSASPSVVSTAVAADVLLSPMGIGVADADVVDGAVDAADADAVGAGARKRLFAQVVRHDDVHVKVEDDDAPPMKRRPLWPPTLGAPPCDVVLTPLYGWVGVTAETGDDDGGVFRVPFHQVVKRPQQAFRFLNGLTQTPVTASAPTSLSAPATATAAPASAPATATASAPAATASASASSAPASTNGVPPTVLVPVLTLQPASPNERVFVKLNLQHLVVAPLSSNADVAAASAGARKSETLRCLVAQTGATSCASGGCKANVCVMNFNCGGAGQTASFQPIPTEDATMQQIVCLPATVFVAVTAMPHSFIQVSGCVRVGRGIGTGAFRHLFFNETSTSSCRVEGAGVSTEKEQAEFLVSEHRTHNQLYFARGGL